MLVITGAAGFIGSCVLEKFNSEGINDILLADDFSKTEKQNNYSSKEFKIKIERKDFLEWFSENNKQVNAVIHIGARTDTAEFDVSVFNKLNLEYSKNIWNICTQNKIPLIYASSAATYGMGEQGYADDESKIKLLKPLNPYGESKNEFDKWVIDQKEFPPQWQGLKFFNVYVPSEYHKGRMASVIFHAFHQIKKTGKVKLFKSHHSDYKDGEQLRDFVYVKDVVEVIWFLFSNKTTNGIFNLGSGTARTFKDLALSVFKAMNLTEQIEYIDTPMDIRDKYQYFTKADMKKLISSGYSKKFNSLEAGINDYVKNYLLTGRYL